MRSLAIMKTLAIIQCSKKKKEYKCPAIVMYSESTLFKSCVDIARHLNSDILIISTKHGFLNPEDIIEPYDFGIEGGPLISSESKEDRKDRTDINREREHHFYNVILSQKKKYYNIINKYDRVIILANQIFYKRMFRNFCLENDKFEYWFEGANDFFNLPNHLKTKLSLEIIKKNKKKKPFICIFCQKEFWNERKASFCSQICRNNNWKKNNPEKRKASDIKYSDIHKDKIKHNFDKWIVDNKERHKLSTLKNREENRERYNSYMKQYRENPENQKRRADYNRNLYHTDEEFQLMSKMRARINLALKRQNSPKYYQTLDLIGCSPHFLNEYLKNEYMEKNNIATKEEFQEYKKLYRLEVDHIKDISLFNLKDKGEQLKSSHYINLKYLARKDNEEKPKHFRRTEDKNEKDI